MSITCTFTEPCAETGQDESKTIPLWAALFRDPADWPEDVQDEMEGIRAEAVAMLEDFNRLNRLRPNAFASYRRQMQAAKEAIERKAAKILGLNCEAI